MLVILDGPWYVLNYIPCFTLAKLLIFHRPKSSRGRHVNSQQNAAYTYPDEAYATNQTRGRPVVKEQKSYYKPLKTDDDTSQSDIPERPKSSRGRQRQHPDASSSYGESVAQSP